MLEWNKETGSNTVKEFADRFGDDSVVLFECDVSKQVDLKSKYYITCTISIKNRDKLVMNVII